MTTRNKISLSALAALCLTPGMAQADHKMIAGRTGLPAVREGGDNVWMEHGVVQMNVFGRSTVVTQTYRLHYPGPPLETGWQRIRVAVREDYFRATDHGAPPVTVREAKGFTGFAVFIDGRRVASRAEPWRLNEKRDTATRWRTWNITFHPGQVHQMRIVSRAPLGQEAQRKYFQFVSKDLSAWRGTPELLEIRFSVPGALEARLGGVEPRPNDVNSRAIRWVYRKTRPHRDIYVQMPPGFARTARYESEP